MMILTGSKNRKGLIVCSICAATILTLIMVSVYRPLHAAAAEENRSLKKACIKATICAINQEINLYRQRLKAAEDGAEYRKRIKELKSERRKYFFMRIDDYTLPQNQTVTVAVTQSYRPGTILELTNLTRSGPFYHLAGIKDNNYRALKAGINYTMTIYKVYQKDYVLPLIENYYVYVSDFSVIN